MTTPLVCATMTAPTLDELRRRRDAAVDADLVELRLDSVRDPDVAGALAGRRCPVIVTCRPTWEGGAFAGSEEERQRILAGAVAAGAEYVDVEWKAGFAADLLRTTGGRGLVLSNHDFDGVPSDLGERAQQMLATGAAMVKIAAKANRLDDCIALRDVGAQAAPGRMVVIGMSDAGLVTRVLPGLFNSSWTYAGELTGIGQLALGQLLQEYDVKGRSAATHIYGVVGKPIGHSVSPSMHNAAIRARGLDAVYLPLHAADVEDFIGFARAFGVKGASVTIPFKVPLLDAIGAADDLAVNVGAVNTIRMSGARWEGTNTDVAGFLQPLEGRGVLSVGLRASILGAGGSARAVAIALMRSGARVTVHARRPDAAAALARMIPVPTRAPTPGQTAMEIGEWPPPHGSWDLLVNCTPVGMRPRTDESPVSSDALAGGIVYDLIYNPVETRLLREAAQAGCRTIGGLDMLVSQAEAQFAWWHGALPEPGVMRAAAVKRLAEYEHGARDR